MTEEEFNSLEIGDIIHGITEPHVEYTIIEKILNNHYFGDSNTKFKYRIIPKTSTGIACAFQYWTLVRKANRVCI